MDLREKVSEYAKRINQENKKHDENILYRREEAKTEAKKLVDALITEVPGIKQIWGFGSVFEENRPFTETSDIDLALEGGDYFAAFKLVEKSTFKVDLIDITNQTDNFASLVRKHGKALL